MNTTTNTSNAITNAVNKGSAPAQKMFSSIIQSTGFQNAIKNTLTDPKKAERFTADIITAVTSNPALQNCTPASILAAGLLGAALDLVPSPQLGQYYLVPYKDKAQFQLGYKGYLQLAIRSGEYERINVVSIKNGELIEYNHAEERYVFKYIEDEAVRERTETIGYYAYFETKNGYKKSIYWSKEKVTAHAKRYSKNYNNSNSLWQKDFDVMAHKTMIKQLISKWGIMSIQMQNAYSSDMTTANFDEDTGAVTPDFVVNDYETSDDYEVVVNE